MKFGLLWLLPCLLAACGNTDDSGTPDAGQDAVQDAFNHQDAGQDGDLDSQFDGGVDAGPDANSDAGGDESSLPAWPDVLGICVAGTAVAGLFCWVRWNELKWLLSSRGR